MGGLGERGADGRGVNSGNGQRVRREDGGRNDLFFSISQEKR